VAGLQAVFVTFVKDKRVFDNALVVCFSENGPDSGTHSPRNIPYVLVGNAGGSFRTGRHVKCGHRTPNDLYVSIQNAFGITDSIFGDPAACRGPISQLANPRRAVGGLNNRMRRSAVGASPRAAAGPVELDEAELCHPFEVRIE
jgi:hypothetical protein